MTNKKLYRSSNRMIAGVLAGLAEYFNLDVSLIRIIYVLLSICSAGFPGLLAYVIMWFVVPEREQF